MIATTKSSDATRWDGFVCKVLDRTSIRHLHIDAVQRDFDARLSFLDPRQLQRLLVVGGLEPRQACFDPVDALFAFVDPTL